jgi:hypothetical protein
MSFLIFNLLWGQKGKANQNFNFSIWLKLGHCLFFWRKLAKFQPEKYDFDLYKGSSMEKNDPNLSDFERKKKISKLLDFFDKFQ